VLGELQHGRQAVLGQKHGERAAEAPQAVLVNTHGKVICGT